MEYGTAGGMFRIPAIAEEALSPVGTFMTMLAGESRRSAAGAGSAARKAKAVVRTSALVFMATHPRGCFSTTAN
jgi:hypothetical protein